MRFSLSSSRIARGEKNSPRTQAAPAAQGVSTSNTCAVEELKGSQQKNRSVSSTRKGCTAWRQLLTKFRWVRRTAFGGAVVPEVERIAAASSGLRSGQKPSTGSSSRL